jgi:hypothetical protein
MTPCVLGSWLEEVLEVSISNNLFFDSKGMCSLVPDVQDACHEPMKPWRVGEEDVRIPLREALDVDVEIQA